MAHAKRAMSEYDQSEQWGMRIRIEMSNAKGSGGGDRGGRDGGRDGGYGGRGGGGRGGGRGRGRGDRGGRGRGGRGGDRGGRSAPYPPRGGGQRYYNLLLRWFKILLEFVTEFQLKKCLCSIN